MRTILVSALALIDPQNRILLAQRPEGKNLAGMWEFPGGKIEPGETAEVALIREIQEELGITLKAEHLNAFTFVSYPYPEFNLLMLLYTARIWVGDPKPLDAQALRWCKAEEMSALSMPPADLPLVEKLAVLLSC